ncbi:MAG TPA: hypothetical protein VII66_03440 [Gemmatimonadaceae bacterium]
MTSSEPIPPPVQKQRKRHLWLKVGVPVVVVPILAIALWVWGTLGFVYSSGERTGYVQKMSHRGWVCKTWEGELAMSPVPGSPPTIFDFTIRDDSLAKALELAAGHQVTLSYAQHKKVPTHCFGETEYFVQGFRIDR